MLGTKTIASTIAVSFVVSFAKVNDLYNSTTTPSFVQYDINKEFDDKRKNNNLDKILRWKTYNDNWNGYGAKKFDTFLLEKTENVLKKLNRQPNIFPTNNSTIQMEYRGVSDSYLELETINSNKMNMMKIDRNKNRVNTQINYEANDINNLVGEFYGD